MADITFINKTYIETPEFTNPTEDLTLRINLSDGEQVLFTAEKEFYTPRRIATNKADVVKLENVMEYTPNNIPILKIQNGQNELTKPQYYINSIVRDVYKQYPLDNFFTELDDELALPDYVGTLAEQRQLALSALLNLEDLASAATVDDIFAVQDATEGLDQNFSDIAGLDAIRDLTPAEITTPTEEDQLSALDFVGLSSGPGSVPGGYVSSPQQPTGNIGIPGGTTGTVGPGGIINPTQDPGDNINQTSDGIDFPLDNGLDAGAGLFSSADTASDIIDPVPSVDATGLILVQSETGIPELAGEVPGISTVNSALNLLNTGIQQIEGVSQGSNQATGNCNTITIAEGKKGYSSSGKVGGTISPERKVSRAEIEKKLADVKDDIAQQENSTITIIDTKSGIPTLVKVQKSSLFGKLVKNLSIAGSLSTLSKTVGGPQLFSNSKGVVKRVDVPPGYKPMQKQDVLNVLYKTKEELENILAQGC